MAERPVIVLGAGGHAKVVVDLLIKLGRTVAAASSNEKDVSFNGGNVAGAKEVGRLVAERAKEKGIKSVVFDRGGYLYQPAERPVDVRQPAARPGGLGDDGCVGGLGQRMSQRIARGVDREIVESDGLFHVRVSRARRRGGGRVGSTSERAARAQDSLPTLRSSTAQPSSPNLVFQSL